MKSVHLSLQEKKKGALVKLNKLQNETPASIFQEYQPQNLVLHTCEFTISLHFKQTDLDCIN